MSERVGSPTPRVFTPPLRELTPATSLGFALIEFAEDVVGVPLLPWQKWLAVHALEMLPDGTFRFRTVVLLVARQNGKSTFMQILALFFMYVRGVDLVIGTAQNLDIAEEVWQGAVDIAQDVPELSAEIARVNMTNGKKSLELRDGERWKVQAANRRGGRGLSGDLVLMDELREHQSWDAWGAVTKTTLARSHAMILAASNAGDAASMVLRFLRKLAHLSIGDPDGLADESDLAPEDDELAEDLDESLGIFEWSAPPGCGTGDRDAWAMANPSLGHTIAERSISSARRTDPEWVFRTEVLCQWSDGSLEGPFPSGSWENMHDADPAGCLDPNSAIPEGGRYVFCVDTSWDRSTSHVAVAGWRADGLPHVELVASRAGTNWVPGWLAERAGAPGLVGVVVQTSGAPAASLAPDLETTGVPVLAWHGTALGGATGAFYDRVRAGHLRHRAQPVLDVAAATAATKPLGDAWVWDRKRSPVDVAPLVAVTGALWALEQHKDPVQSAYANEDHSLMVL